MPELPEVEVVKKSLERTINRSVIKKIVINNDKLRYKVDRARLNKIINLKIISIKRRSKYLLLNLNKKFTILVHLGMTGKFFISSKNKRLKTSFYYTLSEKDEKHNHIVFFFKNNLKLIYNDVRRFGFIKLLSNKNIYNNKHLINLGPEPLSKKFNINYFKKYTKNKKSKIKDLLMNQNFIAGLGNIYVNESLFLSKINPQKKINEIQNFKLKKLVLNIKKILKKSIKEGGSSIKDFTSSDGKSGNYQSNFFVYGRINKKCLKPFCFGTIKKVSISNRASFYCTKCQK